MPKKDRNTTRPSLEISFGGSVGKNEGIKWVTGAFVFAMLVPHHNVYWVSKQCRKRKWPKVLNRLISGSLRVSFSLLRQDRRRAVVLSSTNALLGKRCCKGPDWGTASPRPRPYEKWNLKKWKWWRRGRLTQKNRETRSGSGGNSSSNNNSFRQEDHFANAVAVRSAKTIVIAANTKLMA